MNLPDKVKLTHEGKERQTEDVMGTGAVTLIPSGMAKTATLWVVNGGAGEQIWSPAEPLGAGELNGDMSSSR